MSNYRTGLLKIARATELHKNAGLPSTVANALERVRRVGVKREMLAAAKAGKAFDVGPEALRAGVPLHMIVAESERQAVGNTAVPERLRQFVKGETVTAPVTEFKEPNSMLYRAVKKLRTMDAPKAPKPLMTTAEYDSFLKMPKEKQREMAALMLGS